MKKSYSLPEVAAAQVLVLLRQDPLLRQGKLAAAAHLAETYELPISQARVHQARGDTSAALATLEPWRRQVEAKGLEDERLKVMVLLTTRTAETSPRAEAIRYLAEGHAKGKVVITVEYNNKTGQGNCTGQFK